MSFSLTDEQLAVVHHSSGHARVLAVAGSGKTSTMVHRIKHLIENKGADPKRIRAIMFNRLAKDQFTSKLIEVGLNAARSPYVNTFHSFALQFIQHAITRGCLPAYHLWIEEDAEKMRLIAHRVIRSLVKDGTVPEDSIDVDEALETIALWKGSLIPPTRAGHRYNPNLPIVYEHIEQERIENNGLTFDDFVPLIVELLQTQENLFNQWCGKVDYLIIDEYQDINYGQQKMMELLAGEKAEVMVVGDDDQTIYEWRGARPDYIIRDFQRAFPNLPHTTYKLTRTFRFGPLIAQCANSTIAMNANRQEKNLIADRVRLSSKINLFLSNETHRAHYWTLFQVDNHVTAT